MLVGSIGNSICSHLSSGHLPVLERAHYKLWSSSLCCIDFQYAKQSIFTPVARPRARFKQVAKLTTVKPVFHQLCGREKCHNIWRFPPVKSSSSAF